MIRRLLVLCAAIALAIPAAAHAQSKGQFQVGVGAGMPFYADTLGLDDTVGFGGRLGYMFSDKIGLEGDVVLLLDAAHRRRPTPARHDRDADPRPPDLQRPAGQERHRDLRPRRHLQPLGR